MLKEASLADKVERLAKKVAELERIKRIYDNAHTPPSKMTYTQKKIAAGKRAGSRPKSGRKQGAQKGHPGKTNKPEPAEFEHSMSECAACGSGRINETGRKIRDITEIPPPAKAVTTRHTISVYECRRCGRKGMEPDAGLPGAGNLGRNARVRIADNFVCRMPQRMNGERMGRDGLRVSAGTVNNVLARAGGNLKPVAAGLIAAMQRAGVLHIDETSFKLNGKIIWVWIFFDLLTGGALFVLRPRRGRDVLHEVLPEFNGVIVCYG